MKKKKIFFKDLFYFMNNAVFGKVFENAKKHRHIKLVTTEARKTYFIPKPNYLQFFSEIVLAIEVKKHK